MSVYEGSSSPTCKAGWSALVAVAQVERPSEVCYVGPRSPRLPTASLPRGCRCRSGVLTAVALGASGSGPRSRERHGLRIVGETRPTHLHLTGDGRHRHGASGHRGADAGAARVRITRADTNRACGIPVCPRPGRCGRMSSLCPRIASPGMLARTAAPAPTRTATRREGEPTAPSRCPSTRRRPVPGDLPFGAGKRPPAMQDAWPRQAAG